MADDSLARRLGRIAPWLAVAVCYAAWMTGGSFVFSEIERLPNYQQLAEAFSAGRTSIAESPRVDVAVADGRRYLYFGPVPAVLRAPLAALGVAVPTGLAVIVLATLMGLAFDRLTHRLAPSDRSGRRLRLLFSITFAANGLTLFMTVLPSIHHEAILCAGVFLLLAVGAFERALAEPSPRSALGVGVAGALAIGSRFSCLAAVVVLIGGLVVGAGRSRRRVVAVGGAALAPVVLMAGLLAGYNAVRFGSVFDFGVGRLTSRYSDYIRDGNFWRLDHVPFNLWDYFGRPPEVTAGPPYLSSTITMVEVTRRTATVRPPYYLLHVNELATSVILLLPIVLLAGPGVATLRVPDRPRQRLLVATVGSMIVAQLVPLSLTIASTARYLFDFVPLVMVLAFVGAVRLEQGCRHGRCWVVAMAVISVLVSLGLPLSAIREYQPFLGWRSPLLDLLGW